MSQTEHLIGLLEALETSARARLERVSSASVASLKNAPERAELRGRISAYRVAIDLAQRLLLEEVPDA